MKIATHLCTWALMLLTPSTYAGLTLSVLSTNAPNGHPTGSAKGIAGDAVISDDGHYLFYASTDPGAPSLNIYRRDLVHGTVKAITSDNLGSPVPLATSADGTLLILACNGVPAAPGTTPVASGLYQWDDHTGKITQLAPAGGPGTAPELFLGNAILTPDGKWLAFENTSDGVVSGGGPGTVEIFLRDMTSGDTRQISLQPAATRRGSPRLIGLSQDAKTLAYGLTLNTNLPAGPLLETDLVVVDLPNGVERRLTAAIAPLGRLTSVETVNASMSADGHYVSARIGLGASIELTPVTSAIMGSVVWWDVAAGTQTLAYRGSTAIPDEDAGPVMAPDGKSLLMLYMRPALGVVGPEIRIWQPESGLRTLAQSITQTNSAPPNNEPISPANLQFTRDGQVVLFTVATSNTPGAPTPLFQQELATGIRRMLSVDSLGQPIHVDTPFVTPSADGRFIAFNTAKTTSISADPTAAQSLFLIDNADGKVTGIAPPVMDPTRGTANGQSTVNLTGAVSANGRLTLFTSIAALTAEDKNDSPDLYLHDRVTGKNSLASVRTNGLAAGRVSPNPALSADGQWAAYVATGPGIVPEVTNQVSHIYLRNLVTGATTLIDHLPLSSAPGSANSDSPIISADDRYVFYTNSGRDLTTDLPLAFGSNLFIYDRITDQSHLLNPVRFTSPRIANITLAANAPIAAFSDTRLDAPLRAIYLFDSRNNTPFVAAFDGFPNTGGSLALSPDGQRLACNDGDGGLYVMDTIPSALPQKMYSAPGTRLAEIQFTGDGRNVLFTRTMPATNGGTADRQVILLPLSSREPDVVSRPDDRISGPDMADQISASADGRYVAFRSTATNLVANLPPGLNLFIRDRDGGITYGLGQGPQSFPGATQISADGHQWIFRSASPLVPVDANGLFDVFAVTLADDSLPFDADADGLPDVWERHYFYNLSATATGDPDGDGISNLAEYLAGTSPRQAPQSVVLSAPVSGPTEGLTLKFTALSSGELRLETSEDLTAPWQLHENYFFGPGETVERTLPISPNSAVKFLRYTVNP